MEITNCETPVLHSENNIKICNELKFRMNLRNMHGRVCFLKH
jgi:hypothetical protein